MDTYIVALHCTYSGHGCMYMVYEAIQEQDHLTFKRCKLHSNNNDNITIAYTHGYGKKMGVRYYAALAGH